VVYRSSARASSRLEFTAMQIPILQYMELDRIVGIASIKSQLESADPTISFVLGYWKTVM